MGRMQPATVLLVHPASFHWTNVTTILQDWPEMHIVDDVPTRAPAILDTAREQPDFIFVASDLTGVAPVPFVHDLLAASPTSQIIMIGKLLNPDEHQQLADLANFLQWNCVTAEKLRSVIEAVRDGTVRVISTEAVRVWQAPERRRQARNANALNLTSKQRATVLGLSNGRTQQEIADAEGVSCRVIEERTANIKGKFDVPTMFMLGAMAERLGFGPRTS